jgi:hypothetical protein
MLIFYDLLDFVAANICVYFQYLFMHMCMRQYFHFWDICSQFLVQFLCSLFVEMFHKKAEN